MILRARNTDLSKYTFISQTNGSWEINSEGELIEKYKDSDHIYGYGIESATLSLTEGGITTDYTRVVGRDLIFPFINFPLK